MKDNFSELFFNHITDPKYNNVSFSPENDILDISRTGLHNIYNRKTLKEQHLHSHSFAELHFSLNGFAVYQFANNLTIKLDQGSWLFIPINYPHKIIEYSNKYVKYSCSFNVNASKQNPLHPDIAYQTLSEIIVFKEPKKGEISKASKHYIKQIYDKICDTNPLSTLTIKSLTSAIILDTVYTLNEKAYPEIKKQENDARLPIAIQFIKDNIYRQISSEDVAQKVYLSHRQLNRIFLNNLSVTIAEFIFEQKCDEAKKLLTSTGLPIHEISEKLGFSDQSYFIRFFKKRAGITPYKFRMNSKKRE